jgi:succinoglycan biosynthesis transport protein ExoP
MLQVAPHWSSNAAASETAPSAQDSFNLRSVFQILQRNRIWVLGFPLVALLLGVLYIIVTPPLFTATTSLLIDPRRVQAFRQEALSGDMTFDTATVESQIQTILSDRVALDVVRRLRLLADPEFGQSRGLLSGIFGPILRALFGEGEVRSVEQRTAEMVELLKSNLVVRRIGLSYAIDVSYTDRSPQRAAQLANAFAESYILDQLESKFEVTQRASAWLQERIRELRERATAADRAVTEFRVANSITDVGGGRLISDQQLTELTSQMTAARAQVAEAQARLDRIIEVNRSGVPDAAVTDAIRNEVIVRLRQRYLDASQREGEWSRRYGPNHGAVVQLRSEMTEARRAISAELQRIEQTYRSDLEIARARAESITQSMAQLLNTSNEVRQAQITLRELESQSQSYRSLYDSFMQRYMFAVQAQSFPLTEARVITQATVPFRKSAPRTPVVLAASFSLGLILGFGFVFGREYLDRAVRTQEQLDAITGVNCVAILPDVSVAGGAAPLDYVLREPLSQFAEGIRSIKVSLDMFALSGDAKLIGVVSAISGEGKTTIALNLARLMAKGGSRALLIDADLWNPELSRSVASEAQVGLLEVVRGNVPLADALWHDAVSGLSILPAVLSVRAHHFSHELLNSPAMKRLLQQARADFDYVILDLPPIGAVVDARAMAPALDGFLLVAQWGRTKSDVLRRALAAAPGVAERLMGSILNRASVRSLQGYGYAKESILGGDTAYRS